MVNKIRELLDKTHSQYHFVFNAKEILLEQGFEELNETANWNIKLNGKYFVTRGDTSIIAFEVPNKLDGDGQFQLIASHSDSPCLKLKENPIHKDSNYIKINCEVYGGLILSSYLDKPLSIAGRVLVKNKEGMVSKLIDIDKDLFVIPNVAVHMNRNINDGFVYNKAVDLVPLAGLNNDKDYWETIVKKYFINDDEELVGHDLLVYNRQKSTVFGVEDELIASPKLDNLECAYTTLFGFIEGNPKENVVNVYCCFDNEEVGSSSINGADSSFLCDVLNRINLSVGGKQEDYYRMCAKSFLVSSDNAHAVHPNHPEFSDSDNSVLMNKGIVIKHNSNMFYITDGLSEAIAKEVGKACDVPLQHFANRSDMRGGSTLGNISQTHLSIHGVDIGLPQLAMHSNFEVAGVKDINYLFYFTKCYFNGKVDINNILKFSK